MKTTATRTLLAKRAVVYGLCAVLYAQPGLAAITDISAEPLASAVGAGILPNSMFILDDSGSMGWTYLPDYVNDSDTCTRDDANSTSACTEGEPPYYAGGPRGFNGVAYDPLTYYLPGVNSDGTPYTAAPLNTTSLEPDAYLGGTNVNLTSGIRDRTYCNASSSSVCKRNGADNASPPVLTAAGATADGFTMGIGQFPYRTFDGNSSTVTFTLPEMMAMGSFTRSGTTVTVTTPTAHGLTTSDRVWVDHSNNSFDVGCAAITGVTTAAPFTFTYTVSGSGGIAASAGTYRRCVHEASGTAFARGGSSATVTVTTAAAHGLVTNDRITTRNVTGTNIQGTGVAITVTGTNSFTYVSGQSGAQNSSGSWVRTGLYSRASNQNGSALFYKITPIEYCSDDFLTTCTLATTPGVAPAGFPFPAYVRYCKSREDALAPGLVSGTSGSPATSRCQAKYINTTGNVYRFPRYGLFSREHIRSTQTSYTDRTGRVDCASAPTCTYEEEIQNYARWYTYYRTRMQMMKTATGRALLGFIGNPTGNPKRPNSLRMGFITINPLNRNSDNSSQTNIHSSKYERIRDFDTTQAGLIYNKLYAIIPNPRTPLRQALARVGWIYSGKLGSGLTPGLVAADDPVEASCQRNFSLLTTDGYWNEDNGQTLGGGDTGNMDGVNPTLVAPYSTNMVDRVGGTFDGSNPADVTVVTTEVTLVEDQEVCQGQNVMFGTAGTNCGCPVTQHRLVKRTRQRNHVTTTLNSVVQSDTTSFSGNPIYSAPDVTNPCMAANGTQEVTAVVETEQKVCSYDNNTTFSGGGGGSAPTPPQTDCDCSTSSSSTRYRVRQRQITYERTKVTIDGVVTQDSTGSVLTTVHSPDPATTNTSTAPACTNSSANAAAAGITIPGGFSVVDSAPVVTALVGTDLVADPTVVETPVSLVSQAGTGGIGNTLADVAMYYYMNDLRGGFDGSGNPTGPATRGNAGVTDVALNNVPAKSGAKDFVTHQHMVTFTLGLVDGLMRYRADYETATTGDFANIKAGATSACFWNGSGTCNWPVPAEDSPTALDDLWHAAVNGRGQYYQATNATALAVGLAGALSALNAQVAAAAASATSSPNVTQTENQIFSTTYETNTWSGKVFAQTIDPATGNVNPTIQWQADTLLLGKVTPTSDTRTIYTFDDAGTGVKPFDVASLDADELVWFTDKCVPATAMAQCVDLSAGQLTTANSAANMIGFLRGWTGLELSDPTNGVYRDRTFIDPNTNAVTQTVMGDTITAKPAYMRRPTFNYGGTYNDFKTAHNGREPRVYVGANDGYLHAFHGDTGQEVWAYAPRFLLPNLYKLADRGYPSQHQYYVDGTPETADIEDPSLTIPWRTILVGGAGGGGRGYYALDITDASAPKGLWEICNDPTLCAIAEPDIGLTYGNPIIGKRSSDGRWVVVVTSGLNNVGATGDGQGWFFVLDALTGQVLHKQRTGEGDGTTPSGLMKISAFFENALNDARFRYIYGGDQFGNVWRLDFGAALAPADIPADPADASLAPTLMHVAQLKDPSGKLQPITTRPSLTRIEDAGPAPGGRVIYIGTGRYLGKADLSDPTSQTPVDNTTSWLQSLYAFKDRDSSWGNDLRNDADLVRQDFTFISATERGLTSEPVDWSVNDGWYVDFVAGPLPGDPDAITTPGERVNIDPRLVLGTLVVATNIPSEGGSCSVGGSSRLYQFNYKSGWPIAGEDGVVGVSGGGTIAVGMAIVQLPSGAIKDIVTGADTSKSTTEVQISAASAGLRRFSYRER